MRVLIMTDMEGVAGIVVWEQVMGGDKLYEEGRRLYTEEINAAVRGAKRAGASRIVVVDCHGAGGPWTFNSLIPELLDEDCEWVAHHGWSEYTELLEEGCDGVLLIGMHAKAGTERGVLCHTVSSTRWRDLTFNGVSVGEIGINAALCGSYGVPVRLVTGDEATCEEARRLLGEGLPTFTVKRGLGRFSACSLSPKRARAGIEDAVTAALSRPAVVSAYCPSGPVTIRVSLAGVEHMARFAGRPGIRALDPMTIESEGDDWLTAWRQIWNWNPV